jgi:hypothetical protein
MTHPTSAAAFPPPPRPIVSFTPDIVPVPQARHGRASVVQENGLRRRRDEFGDIRAVRRMLREIEQARENYQHRNDVVTEQGQVMPISDTWLVPFRVGI